MNILIQSMMTICTKIHKLRTGLFSKFLNRLNCSEDLEQSAFLRISFSHDFDLDLEKRNPNFSHATEAFIRFGVNRYYYRVEPSP